jgi:hypothetical protein
LIEKVEKLGQEIGITKACQALVVPRSRVYRARTSNRETRIPGAKPKPYSRFPSRAKSRSSE